MINVTNKHSLYISFGLGILFLLPVDAAAVTFKQSLNLPLALEYETNPRLSSSNKEPARRTTLIPAYTLMATQGNDQFEVKLGLNIERSSNQSASADREDPNVSVDWSHTYETGQFGVTANFSKRSTRFSEFNDTGTVTNNNTRQTRALGGNWTTALSDRYSLSFNADLTKVTFDSLTGGLNDYDNKSINTQLTYSLNEQVDLFSRVSLSRFEPVSNSATNFRSVDVGGAWSLSDNFSIDASVGINETGGSNGESGWQASFDSTYSLERSNLTAGLSRSRAPSGSGVIRESNQLSAGWTYNLSEKENVAVNISYRENLGINKNDTMLFSADYTRALAPEWDVKLSARYRNRDDTINSVSSNIFTATIIYKLPDF